MMLGLIAMLLTQTASPKDPVKLASVGFTAVRVPKDLAASFDQTLALRLRETGLVRVTTQSDIANVLGVERQRELLGCKNDSTSCIAELAGALGVEGIISGEIALVGKVYQLTVRILSARDGSVLFQSLRRLKNEEEGLEELDRAGAEGAKKVYALLRAAPVVKPPEVKPAEVVSKPIEAPPAAVSQPMASPSPRIGPWVVMGLGAVLLVGGAVSQGMAVSDYQRLRDTSVVVTDLEGLANSGKLKQLIGLSGLGAGAVALGGGLLWYFLGRESAPMTSVWISREGAGLVLSGHY